MGLHPMYIINHHEEHKEHEEKILTKKIIFKWLFLRELRGLQ